MTAVLSTQPFPETLDTGEKLHFWKSAKWVPTNGGRCISKNLSPDYAAKELLIRGARGHHDSGIAFGIKVTASRTYTPRISDPTHDADNRRAQRLSFARDGCHLE